MKDTKTIIKFTRQCLKEEGYSSELIAYLFSNYDLETFINETVMNKLEIATHFLSHAREIDLAATRY